MSTTTKKHRDFVGEPIGSKPVSALPGIGEVLGKRMEQQDFSKAYMVLGQFLLLRKDVELFTEWLKDVSGANEYQAGLCARGLRECIDSRDVGAQAWRAAIQPGLLASQVENAFSWVPACWEIVALEDWVPTPLIQSL